METRTSARLDQQLTRIIEDLEVELERAPAKLEVNDMDATQTTTASGLGLDAATEDAALRQTLRELHRALAQRDISLSWFIDREDQVRLLISWTQEVAVGQGVISLRSWSYDYALSRSEAARLAAGAARGSDTTGRLRRWRRGHGPAATRLPPHNSDEAWYLPRRVGRRILCA